MDFFSDEIKEEKPKEPEIDFEDIKKRLKDEATKLLREKEGQAIFMDETIKKLEKELENLKKKNAKIKMDYSKNIESVSGLVKEKEAIQAKYKSNTTIIGINVGGKIYQVLAKTLLNKIPKSRKDLKTKVPHFFSYFVHKDCMFPKDDKGNYFIDRKGKTFKYILNYLRANGNTNEFEIPEEEADQNELMEEALYYKMEHLYMFLKEGEIFRSRIFKTHKDFDYLKEKCFGKDNQIGIKLIFSTDRDGYTSAAFAEKVYGKGPCLVVIKALNGYVFGGYNPVGYSGTNNYVNSSSAFLFSLKNQDGKVFYKFSIKPGHTANAVYDNRNYIGFGSGHDICFYLNKYQQNSNYLNLNHSYDSQGKHQYFCSGGTRNYFVESFEVYQKIDLSKKYSSDSDDDSDLESEGESDEVSDDELF